ncbi:MAG: hypothetical protein KAX38_07890, partial [Candidatus Krumholzibacteria bacterium]|nr:hypothetical protein [Candidatus Krumholzibacteria bacterium]
IASGVGAAFAGQGLNVTLLEVGRGLPNIGYYFGLDPADYLAPTLDESRLLMGASGSSIRYAYAIDPGTLVTGQNGPFAPRYPHVIVAAFSYQNDIHDEEFFRQLGLCSACCSGIKDKDEHRHPDGVVIFGDEGSKDRRKRIMDLSRHLNPGAIIFFIGSTLSGELENGVDESMLPPGDLYRSCGKRRPPSDAFYSDLVCGFLQVLSYRRRRVAADAVG